MKQDTVNYAVILHELNVGKQSVEEAKSLILNKDLLNALCDPTIKLNEKEAVIDRIFSGVMASFLKTVCKYGKCNLLPSILDYYDSVCAMSDGTILATITCVEKPSDEQEDKIKKFLCKKFAGNSVKLDYVVDKSLIGGFIIKCGDIEYDRSLQSRLTALQQKLIGEVK